MNDADVLEHLQSYAPLDSFYVCAGDNVVRFKDETGKGWTLAIDNDEVAARAVELLKARGAKVFDDFFAMLEYEKQSKGYGEI
jgi:hypothetical protein